MQNSTLFPWCLRSIMHAEYKALRFWAVIQSSTPQAVNRVQRKVGGGIVYLQPACVQAQPPRVLLDVVQAAVLQGPAYAQTQLKPYGASCGRQQMRRCSSWSSPCGAVLNLATSCSWAAGASSVQCAARRRLHAAGASGVWTVSMCKSDLWFAAHGQPSSAATDSMNDPANLPATGARTTVHSSIGICGCRV